MIALSNCCMKNAPATIRAMSRLLADNFISDDCKSGPCSSKCIVASDAKRQVCQERRRKLDCLARVDPANRRASQPVCHIFSRMRSTAAVQLAIALRCGAVNNSNCCACVSSDTPTPNKRSSARGCSLSHSFNKRAAASAMTRVSCVGGCNCVGVCKC